ncbi:uncharacterized protein LOC130518394 [Takifugu flavidus]|uniref:uncharacterized protein LOC130518394 n=1 Tax=Takifugu flavidus TaxID=433684 RepID=UPI002543FD5F|nr:uncharacterized protein LOC130518394 [Takifugu flavidus]
MGLLLSPPLFSGVCKNFLVDQDKAREHTQNRTFQHLRFSSSSLSNMKILGICSLLLLAKSNAQSSPGPSTTTTPITTLEGTNNPTMGTSTTMMGTSTTTTTMDTRTTTMGTANTTMVPEVTTVNSTVTNATTTPQTTPGNGGSVLTASLLFPLVSAVLWVL